MTARQATCETCGREIPAGAPGGECPACLLEIALDDGSESGDFEGPYRIEDLEQLFPSLEIVEYIGRGGMGVVYRAVQRNLDRPVALKILSPEISGDRAFAERFEREARALARLSHPNIVAVHESGRAGDLCYLLMEYVDGVNLRQALRAAKLSPQEALAIVPQICDALQYAHDRGVVHRDIKPENVLVDRDGHVKIADFGLAKLVGAEASLISLTADQQAMGTAHYIAPEQLKNARDVDHRADIYSLGVVFYEMLTGDIPMGRFQPPSKKVQIDVRLDEVVLRALEQERDLRYQQVSELKSGVESASTPTPAGDAAAPVIAGSLRPTRVPTTAILGILGLPAGVLAGAIAYESGMRDEGATLICGIVVLIGVILSAIARSAIKAAPGHLRGFKLATIGIRMPILVTLGVVAITAIIYFSRGGGMPGRVRDAAEVQRVRENAAIVTAAVRKYLSQIDSFGGMTPVDEIARLFDPESRRVFEDTASEEFRQLYLRQELGLAMIDRDRFPEGMSAFTVEQVEVSGDEATVSIRHGSCCITFPMKRSGGEWYLSVGKLKVVGLPAAPSGTTREGLQETVEVNRILGHQIDITKAVNECLGKIDSFVGMPPLDVIAEMFDPQDRAKFRSLSDADLRRLTQAGELGLAMIATQSFPDGMAAFRVEEVEVTGDEAKVTIHHQGWHIAFPMRRSGGRWYLGMGRVDTAALPDGHITSRVYRYLRQIDMFEGLLPREEIAKMLDSPSRARLAGLSDDEFGRLTEARELGLAGFDRSTVIGHGVGIGTFSVTHLTIIDDGSRASVTIENHPFRITFPMAREDGRWYLTLGKLVITSRSAAPEPAEEVIRGSMPTAQDLLEEVRITGAVIDFLGQIERLGRQRPPSEVAKMFDPRDRATFQGLSEAELQRRMRACELGLAMIAQETLPHPIKASYVKEFEIRGDRATVTLGHQGGLITFPMKRIESRWYLGLGKVVIERAAPTSREGR